MKCHDVIYIYICNYIGSDCPYETCSDLVDDYVMYMRLIIISILCWKLHSLKHSWMWKLGLLKH